MRGLLAAAALMAALAVTGGVAIAAPAICLDTTRISGTHEPDERTILFKMNDGTVWKNTLRNSCPGLRFYGFSYEAAPPHQICGNLQSIRVLRTGAVCMLGAFEKVSAPGAKP